VFDDSSGRSNGFAGISQQVIVAAQPVVEHFLNTGTFVKRDGEWRVVAWQSTRVPES